MKKVLCKGKWLLILLLLIMIPTIVKAEDTEKAANSSACDNYLNEINGTDALNHKYAIKTKVEDDKFIIYIKKDSMDDSVKKVKYRFKISEINGYKEEGAPSALDVRDENVINNEYIVSTNKVLSSTNNTIVLKKNALVSEQTPVFLITLVPDGFSDPDLTSVCGKNTEFAIYLSGTSGPEVQALKEDEVIEDLKVTIARLEPIKGSSKKLIDCGNYTSWDKNSFNYKFCDARVKAQNIGTTNLTGGKELKCDVTKINYTDDYYVNKAYYMTTGEIPMDDVTYKNNYTCDKESSYSGGKCKIKCEEVVTVEYGPPAAQKAGFCFEYKVKVTSRVSCGVESYPPPPSEDQLCTPVPLCTKPGTNIRHHQGGPNEDFDSCVVQCDGGVYSDRCTNKCYKEVYGKTNVKNTTGSEINYVDTLDSSNRSTTSSKKVTSGSRKYYCSGDTIIWDGGQDQSRDDNSRDLSGYWDSRWHRTYPWDFWDHNGYECVSGTGIPRRCGCTETCFWTIGNCKYATVNNKHVVQGYLNPGDATAAYNEKIKEYNNYIKKCEAAASCTTTKTTFTIGTKVGNDTYNFPLSKNKTEKKNVKSPKDYFERITNTTAQHSFNDDYTTIIKNSNIGCYKPEYKGNDIEYGAEWTFPGSFIYRKTGEISYDQSHKSEKSWRNKDKLFCLPLDAPKEVNTAWWDYYYTNNAGITNRNYSFEGSDCQEGCGFTKRTSITSKDITDWNIFAKTENFGHYKWNIDISCFYASRPELSTKKDPDEEPIRIRSVDLENLFPNPDGSQISSPDELGRTPGFNWTEYATNTKDSQYVSYPELYAKAVQKKETDNHSVFDEDSELDYHIRLNRNNINNIKAIASGKRKYQGKEFVLFDNDDELKANGSDNSSAPHYKSKFIRDNQYASIQLGPSDSALLCNNIIHRTTCDNSLKTN